MASMASSDSPMEARRLRSSRMLRPASTRIRVFSVARSAALPELPLASTQNFTMIFSPNLQNTPNPIETESGEFVSGVMWPRPPEEYGPLLPSIGSLRGETVKRTRLPFLLSLLFSASGIFHAQTPQDAPYRNPKMPVEQRVEDLLHRMTPVEKAMMLSGTGWMETQANARLGIPAIKMADGPLGVRSWAGPSARTNAEPVLTTSFPSGIGVGASWDVELAQREGQA